MHRRRNTLCIQVKVFVLPESVRQAMLIGNVAPHTRARTSALVNTHASYPQDTGGDDFLCNNDQDPNRSGTTTSADRSPCNDPRSSQAQRCYSYTAHADMPLFDRGWDPTRDTYSTGADGWGLLQTFASRDFPGHIGVSPAPQGISDASCPTAQGAQTLASEPYYWTAPVESLSTFDMPDHALQTADEPPYGLAGVQARTTQPTSSQGNTYSYGMPQPVSLPGNNPGQLIPKLEESINNRAGTTDTAPSSSSSPQIPIFLYGTMDPAAHDFDADSQSRRSREKSAGGQRPGSHLEPAKAAKTKLMRDEVACWQCCLQRDEVSPSSPDNYSLNTRISARLARSVIVARNGTSVHKLTMA